MASRLADAVRRGGLLTLLALAGGGCADTHSGEERSQVTLTGEPAWTIERIEDQAIPDEPPVRLHFHEDGQLSGQAPCNLLTGHYSRSERKLTIDQVATTRMACPKPVMQLEGRFLRLLPRVEWFRIGLDGKLELVTREGVMLQGRRGE